MAAVASDSGDEIMQEDDTLSLLSREGKGETVRHVDENQ